MPQTTTTSVQDLLAAANAEIEILSLDEAGPPGRDPKRLYTRRQPH